MPPFVAVEKRIDRWDELIRNLQPAISGIMSKTTFDAYGQSQITVPVVTTKLKQSGQPEFTEGGLEGEIRYTMFYAGYVHEGTVRSRANPFLREAVEYVVPSMLMAFRMLEGLLLP